ncbi:DUF932 domain-containing protein [Promicromonospora aerolata]|uniref:DUF932 domain-containing protein n=1 Tax=Promicromonospora aerolata TaxID=195749 RepID=A0ABW4VG50_9MICO
MTRETLTWLNTMTLIGHTDRRGTAWHYKASEQGGEPNHYPGAIPLKDVRARLFNWEGVHRRVAVELPASTFTEATHYGLDNKPMRWEVIGNRSALDRSDRDTGAVFGVVGPDYKIHQYSDWLLENVAGLLHDGLSVSSAGLLKGGAVAWVEVSVPENLMTDEGVEFRPNLLATTTMDGSSATVYKRTITDVVCDNTRAVALKESGAEFKVRHSKNSELRLEQARDALQIVDTAADEFRRQVAELCAIAVTEDDWQLFLDRTVPWGTKTGKPDNDYMRLLKEERRENLTYIYRNDPRCAPWHGTAHGVVQAVNTYDHHVRLPQKKEDQEPDRVSSWRTDRNLQRTVDGLFDELDRETYLDLEAVLEQAA